jgi:hypothetical protein
MVWFGVGVGVDLIRLVVVMCVCAWFGFDIAQDRIYDGSAVCEEPLVVTRKFDVEKLQ